MFSAISKVDSKGRITIPIGFRAKLRLLEGSDVRIVLKNKKLIIFPYNGQSCVNGISSKKASTQLCGSCRPGSIPGSGPMIDGKRGEERKGGYRKITNRKNTAKLSRYYFRWL